MENLSDALDQTADGAYIIDAQQRIIFWNKAAEALLGHSADEVIGRSCYQVFAGRDESGCPICRQRCVPYVASGLGEPVHNFDACVHHKDGQPHWVNVSIIALPAPNGSRSILHLFRNIDTQKQMEKFARDVVSQARQLDPRQRVPATAPVNNASPDRLTRRELQVLDLLAKGMGTAAIAQELIISEMTVRNHIQHILQKLAVHSRLKAVAYAREHNLLS